MRIVDLIQEWIKNYWIFCLIILILIILIIFWIFWILDKIKNKKLTTGILKIQSKKMETHIDVEVKTSFLSFKRKRDTSDVNVAWFTLIEIWTTVLGNKFDDVYGDERAALTSLRSSYRKLRDLVQNNPKAHKSNAIVLQVINIELRPFITKWNRLINEDIKIDEKIPDKIRVDFIEAYNKYYEKIYEKDYINLLCKLAKVNINYEKIVIKNGIDNITS